MQHQCNIPTSIVKQDSAHRACFDAGVYSLKEDDVQMACGVALEAIPKKSGALLSQMVLLHRINQKQPIEGYQFMYDSWTVLTNDYRKLDLQMKCYRAWHSSQAAVAYISASPKVGCEFVSRVVRAFDIFDVESDPLQRFAPSRALVNLVKECLAIPTDEDLLCALNDIGLLHVPEEERERNIENIISEQVEDMLTSFAEQKARTGQDVRISTGKRFTAEVCEELMVRLGLDPLFAPPVLNLLHDKLINFLSAITRRREWGLVFVDHGEIKLNVYTEVFSSPDYAKIMSGDNWEEA